MTRSSPSEQIARTVAGWLFLPVHTDYRRVFKIPTQVVILLVLGTIGALAAPPVVDTMLALNPKVFPFDAIHQNPQLWDRWLSFAGVCSELIIVLLIGGSVFGEWLTARSKDAITKLESAVEAALRKELSEAGDDLTRMIRAYLDMLSGITIRNIVPRLFQLYRESRRILRFSLGDIPRINTRFLLATIGTAFPGGFYGLLAFVMFGIRMFVEVLKLYATAGTGGTG